MPIARSAYPSARSRAWRNLMVAATNAALKQGLLDLKPTWQDRPPERDGKVFRFTFPGGAEGIGAISSAGWDEVAIHAALHPTPDAERWIAASNANFYAGKAFASGWLERRRGPYLQSAKSLFACRADVKAMLANAKIEAAGYTDHGRVIL